MTTSAAYWTPADLLTNQNCDRQLAERISRRALSWVDPFSDVVGPGEPELTDLMASHAEAVRLEVLSELVADSTTGTTARALGGSGDEFGLAVRRTGNALTSKAGITVGVAHQTAKFHGYADLALNSAAGWVLADARLSALAPARAAVMLAALATELEAAGHPVAPHVLLLGVGGVRRRWSRKRLDALITPRVEHVEGVLASLVGDSTSASPGPHTCAACEEKYGSLTSSADDAEGGVPLATMRFPVPRSDDLFLHIEHLQPVLGHDRSHVVLALGAGTGTEVWWGADRAQQVSQSVKLLDVVRRALARDKRMHVFHRGSGVVRHLLRITAGQPEAAHLVASMLGGNGGRVLIDLDDAIDGLGFEAGPTADTSPLLAAAVFAAERLNNRHATRALRERVEVAVVSACGTTRDLRDRVLEHIDGDSGAGLVVPGFTSSFADDLASSLRRRAGVSDERTADEEVWALVASALGYFERERVESERRLQRWLSQPVQVWSSDPEVLTFLEPPVVVRKPGEHDGRFYTTTGLEAIAMDDGNRRVSPGQMQVVCRRGGQPGVTRHVNEVTGTCVVRSAERVGNGRMRVSYDRADLFPRTPAPIALIPREPPDDFDPFRALYDLAGLLDASGELPRNAIVDVLARREPRLSSGFPLPRSGRPIADLAAALQDLDDSYLAVQGPPGTGKTRLGASAVRRLVYDGWKVGVVSQSHAAVEHFLETAIKQGLDPALAVKGARKGVPKNGSWRAIKGLPSHVRENTDGCLVGGTVWTFSDPALTAGSLDLLVVEEAGQLSLAHTAAAARASRNLLLLGDPQQLPGVSEGVHDEPVDVSSLEWLAQGSRVLPERFGYFLPVSYRMSLGLCERVSDLSYDGQLTSDESAAGRRLKGFESGVVRVEVQHVGNGAASPEEADEVVRRIKGLLGAKWFDPARYDYATGLKEGDFLVVAPFNAQVNLIRDTLTKAGLRHVRVGTVDRFQGQEAPVVLLSMASSRLDMTPRSAAFLLDPRRLNVAISRAQWMAVVICSQDLAKVIPEHAADLESLAAFVGLADRVERVST